MRYPRTDAELAASQHVFNTLRGIKTVAAGGTVGGWHNHAPQVVTWASAAENDVQRFHDGLDESFDSDSTLFTFSKWTELVRTAIFGESFVHAIDDLNRRIAQSRDAVANLTAGTRPREA